jgi:hypothetical protein
MFTEDLSVFFSTAEFAVDAVWTPAAGGGPFTIPVIFDNAYREFAMGEADQAGREPECLARDDQLAQGSGMKRGDVVVINSVTYKVGTIEPDGTGVSRIVLRK